MLPLAAGLSAGATDFSRAWGSELVAHRLIALFQGPGEGFRQTGKIAADSKVNVLWCNGDASWCLVQGEDAEGWAPSASVIAKNLATTGGGLSGNGGTTIASGAVNNAPAKSLSTTSDTASGAAGSVAATAAGAAAAAASAAKPVVAH